MTTGVLERLDKELATEVSTERKTATRLSETAGGVQFNSITIIENPSVDGIVGFLMSEGYQDVKGTDEIKLSRVYHTRAFERTKMVIQDPRFYGYATIRKGFDEVTYSFVEADRIVLQRPSRIDYETVFVPPVDFLQAVDLLRSPGSFSEGVMNVYRMMSKSLSNFNLKNDRLEMPKDYASMRMPREPV